MSIDPDGRFAFKRRLTVGPTAILSVEVINGPILQMQAVVFSRDKKPLSGVGTPTFGAALLTDQRGVVSWLFNVPEEVGFIKWGVRAFRSAGDIPSYGVTGKIRDGSSGDTIDSARFNAVMDDDFVDDWIFDGVFLRRGGTGEISSEPTV